LAPLPLTPQGGPPATARSRYASGRGERQAGREEPTRSVETAVHVDPRPVLHQVISWLLHLWPSRPFTHRDRAHTSSRSMVGHFGPRFSGARSGDQFRTFVCPGGQGMSPACLAVDSISHLGPLVKTQFQESHDSGLSLRGARPWRRSNLRRASREPSLVAASALGIASPERRRLAMTRPGNSQ
jgi:hypothetical protein